MPRVPSLSGCARSRSWSSGPCAAAPASSSAYVAVTRRPWSGVPTTGRTRTGGPCSRSAPSPRPSPRCCWPTVSCAGEWSLDDPGARPSPARDRRAVPRRRRDHPRPPCDAHVGTPQRARPARARVGRRCSAGATRMPRLTPDGLLAALAGATPARTPGPVRVHYSNLGVGRPRTGARPRCGHVVRRAGRAACLPARSGLVDTADPRPADRRAACRGSRRGTAAARRPAAPGRSTGCPGPARCARPRTTCSATWRPSSSPTPRPWPTPIRLTPSSPGSTGGSPSASVGCGNDRPDPLWWHNGGTGGFRSFAGFVPDAAHARGGAERTTSRSVDLLGLRTLRIAVEAPR